MEFPNALRFRFPVYGAPENSASPSEQVPANRPSPATPASGEAEASATESERLRRSGSAMQQKVLEQFVSHHVGEPSALQACIPLRGNSPARSPSPVPRTVKVDAPDIVFVGAGPVGLWAAIQLKLRKPELGIRMIEKRDQYTRDNVVKLNVNRFEGCAQDDWGILADLKFKLGESPFMPIRVFERTLWNIANNLNIEIQIAPEGVSDVRTQVVDACPSATVIVGSDGAHSGVRAQMFGEDNFHKQPLRYAAHIKYDIDGAAQKVGKLELYPLLKKMNNHLVHEHVGPCRDGKTSVTVQIFIDAGVYASLKGSATSKNPVRLFSPEPGAVVPPTLLDDVKAMLGLQIVNNGARIDASTVRMSVTEIPQHYCDSVIEPQGGKGRYTALLGDAAMGLSFFKGLNAGLKSANRFAVVVASKWDVPSKPGESAHAHKFSDYQAWFRKYSTMKIKKGNQKNHQLGRIDKMIGFNALTRGHLLKYSDKQFKSFQQAVDHLLAHPGLDTSFKKASPSIGL